MASKTYENARLTGITYRSEDYRTVVVLDGDSAIYQISDGMGWNAETRVDIVKAWNLIARKGLKRA